MKKLSKDTMNTIIGAITLIVIAAALIAPSIIFGLKYRAAENKYLDSEREFYKATIFYTEEFTELETWGEIILEDYEELQEDYRRLQGKYEELLKEADYNVKQIISDYDDAVDYLYNYQSYSERNPDVTLEQFIRMRDYKLWERLMEYGNY